MTENEYIKNIVQLKEYLFKVLNVLIDLHPLDRSELNSLPFYLKSEYDFFTAKNMIYQEEVLFVFLTGKEIPKIRQLKSNLTKLRELINKEAVLILDTPPSFIRNRMIQQGINFIVPGKQLFLPALHIHLEEKSKFPELAKKGLGPSSQLILIYCLLDKGNSIEKYSFTDLANKFEYSPMGISNAIKRLEMNGLCEVRGSKPKHVILSRPKKELWEKSRNGLMNPVKEKWFAEDFSDMGSLLKSNITALAEYTDINPEKTPHFAIYGNSFLSMKNTNLFKGLNKFEGTFCIEKWNYNPKLLVGNDDKVDPLSLYLSLKDNEDERISIALDQLLNQIPW